MTMSDEDDGVVVPQEIDVLEDMDDDSAAVEFTSDGHISIHLPKSIDDDETVDNYVPEHVLLATGLSILLGNTNLAEIAGQVIEGAEDLDNPTDMPLPELKWLYSN